MFQQLEALSNLLQLNGSNNKRVEPQKNQLSDFEVVITNLSSLFRIYHQKQPK